MQFRQRRFFAARSHFYLRKRQRARAANVIHWGRTPSIELGAWFVSTVYIRRCHNFGRLAAFSMQVITANWELKLKRSAGGGCGRCVISYRVAVLKSEMFPVYLIHVSGKI
jgi:hypothetical protein